MGESGVTAVAKANGFTGLLVKALDGDRWMSYYDPDPNAISGPDHVAQLRDWCHENGLDLYVWINPLADVDLDAEASLAAAAANNADGLFLDAEPYRQFWGADRDPRLIRRFLEALRAAAPDAWIALQPDPRETALDNLEADVWMPYVNAISAQHYWSDFGTSSAFELERAYALGQFYNVPSYPTLPGNAPLSSFPADDLIGQFPGFCVWRFGTTPAATLARLGSIAIPV
jgi:hypothetical protein